MYYWLFSAEILGLFGMDSNLPLEAQLANQNGGE
jgi:hypothetical protein